MGSFNVDMVKKFLLNFFLVLYWIFAFYLLILLGVAVLPILGANVVNIFGVSQNTEFLSVLMLFGFPMLFVTLGLLFGYVCFIRSFWLKYKEWIKSRKVFLMKG